MDESQTITSLKWLRGGLVDRYLPSGEIFAFPFGRSRHVFASPAEVQEPAKGGLYYQSIAVVCDEGSAPVVDIATLFDRLVPGGRLTMIVRTARSIESDASRLSASTLQVAIHGELAFRPFLVRLTCDEPDPEGFIACVVEARRENRSQAVAGHEGATQPFEADRSFTRIETPFFAKPERIVALKLDHLGDFIMGVPALQKLRTTFPDANLTLLVGSWNLALAQELGLFDDVIAFDAMARNPSEETVEVSERGAVLAAMLGRKFDLAVDLRCDYDTRPLLKHVDAGVRAGIGTRSRFPFLDIFLPLDSSRYEESARQETFSHHAFESRHGRRMRFDNVFEPRDAAGGSECLLWGPGRSIRSGRFVFEPFIEMAERQTGLLRYEVAVGQEIVDRGHFAKEPPRALAFHNSEDHEKFEFRLFSVEDQSLPGFRYYGGKLIRLAGQSTLHQAEYLQLLVELIDLRLDRFGRLVGSGS